MNLIKKQKLSYFGHIKRHNTLEKLFLEGTCEGRRRRGRPRKRWTQDIGEWMGVSTVEAGRQALERGEFRQAVWEATSLSIRHRRRKRNRFIDISKQKWEASREKLFIFDSDLGNMKSRLESKIIASD